MGVQAAEGVRGAAVRSREGGRGSTPLFYFLRRKPAELPEEEKKAAAGLCEVVHVVLRQAVALAVLFKAELVQRVEEARQHCAQGGSRQGFFARALKSAQSCAPRVAANQDFKKRGHMPSSTSTATRRRTGPGGGAAAGAPGNCSPPRSARPVAMASSAATSGTSPEALLLGLVPALLVERTAATWASIVFQLLSLARGPPPAPPPPPGPSNWAGGRRGGRRPAKSRRRERKICRQGRPPGAGATKGEEPSSPAARRRGGRAPAAGAAAAALAGRAARRPAPRRASTRSRAPRRHFAREPPPTAGTPGTPFENAVAAAGASPGAA